MKKSISLFLLSFFITTALVAGGDDKKSKSEPKVATAESKGTNQVTEKSVEGTQSTAPTKSSCGHNHAEEATPAAAKSCDKAAAGKPCCASHGAPKE